MHTTLAMAGPADAAEFFALVIGWVALCLVGFLAYVAIAARLRVLAWVNGVLHFVLTVLFNPLQVFATLSPLEAGDPDVQAWMSSWRVFFAGWLVVTIGVLAGIFLGSVRKRSKQGPRHCPTCGHDLRSIPGRCPACETLPAVEGVA